MNIFQFFRILWAHRLLIAGMAALCLVIGATVVNVVAPKYQAQARVMLDVIKPDPVTGEVIASALLRAYTKTQTEMIKDQQVARLVVEDLGWDKDAALQQAYRERGSEGRDLDFTTWAAQRVQKGAGAEVIPSSNILEITFDSKSPSEAKRVADALVKAYMSMTLESRRATARRNADWYDAQAEKSRTILFSAESSKAAFERANGIVLQDNRTDIDTARLAALASQGASPVITPSSGGPSPSAVQLAAIDAEIAEQSKTLGPNHPFLQQLRARRSLVATQAGQEQNAASGAVGAAMSAARATAGMLEEQKAKVMAQREKVERLRLMQDEIDLRREQYKAAVARGAQFRQEAEVVEAGVTSMGSAITPQAPVFPNKPLILGASIPAGAVLGILIALILELVGRRVRSAEDLSAATSAPVLAVIFNPASRKKARFAFPSLKRRRGAGDVRTVARA